MERSSSRRVLPRAFYGRPADVVARDLLGRVLEHALDGETVAARIVETEAYLGAPDRASHAWGGRRTARNEAMYRGGGHAYVYFVYGMHHCLNVVCGARDLPHAVLLRAAEPLTPADAEAMGRRRGVAMPARPGALAGGPARLCEAFGIDLAQNGAPLWRGALRLLAGAPVAARRVAVGARIGVAYAGDAAAWPLRFAERDNPHVSRPWPFAGRG
jgi:DNA-3-methyladenine glycosylase